MINNCAHQGGNPELDNPDIHQGRAIGSFVILWSSKVQMRKSHETRTFYRSRKIQGFFSNMTGFETILQNIQGNPATGFQYWFESSKITGEIWTYKYTVRNENTSIVFLTLASVLKLQNSFQAL